MYLGFKYRLYPTVKQEILLTEMLRDHCLLYNAALQERRDAYKMQHHYVSYYAQSAQLKYIRAADPEQGRWSSGSQEQTIRYLDKAFAGFFRRVKAGQVPGYPRFKPIQRFNTVTFRNESGGVKWIDRYIRLQGIGHVKIKLHRPVRGTIKQTHITREGKRWYASACCVDVPEQIRPVTGAIVGVDRGITNLLADSNGGFSSNPHYGRKDEIKMTEAQRNLSRKKRGSNRRYKAVTRVNNQHRKIRNLRADYLHKLSRQLVDTYDVIVLEDLCIINMVRKPKPLPDNAPNGAAAKAGLSKSILDTGWATLARMIQYKAESAGTEVIFVPAVNTSRTCYECGYISADNRNGEAFHCQRCRHIAHADTNAALNILRLGLSRQSYENSLRSRYVSNGVITNSGVPIQFLRYTSSESKLDSQREGDFKMIGTPEFGTLPDAPARGYNSSKHQEAAATLQAQPGEWAKVGSYKTNKTAQAAAYRLKAGKVKAFQPSAEGTYEAAARGEDLWVRFVAGAAGAHAAE